MKIIYHYFGRNHETLASVDSEFLESNSPFDCKF